MHLRGLEVLQQHFVKIVVYVVAHDSAAFDISADYSSAPAVTVADLGESSPSVMVVVVAIHVVSAVAVKYLYYKLG